MFWHNGNKERIYAIETSETEINSIFKRKNF